MSNKQVEDIDREGGKKSEFLKNEEKGRIKKEYNGRQLWNRKEKERRVAGCINSAA